MWPGRKLSSPRPRGHAACAHATVTGLIILRTRHGAWDVDLVRIRRPQGAQDEANDHGHHADFGVRGARRSRPLANDRCPEGCRSHGSRVPRRAERRLPRRGRLRGEARPVPPPRPAGACPRADPDPWGRVGRRNEGRQLAEIPALPRDGMGRDQHRVSAGPGGARARCRRGLPVCTALDNRQR